MILSEEIKDALQSIIQHEKARSVLFEKWGFETLHKSKQGITALFCGVPGTGKSMAAEAIASGLKRPMMKVNVAHILNFLVGQSEKNVDAIFVQAKEKNAVLVFDECEGLFGQRQVDGSRHGKSVVGVLLQNIENFEGICLAITNMREVIDNAFFRRFRLVLEFKMPDVGQRQELWQTIVPEKCPLAPGVSLIDLARRYEMTGSNIKNALVCAATAAALREEAQVVTMKDLVSACDAEVSKKHGTSQAHLCSMYS